MERVEAARRAAATALSGYGTAVAVSPVAMTDRTPCPHCERLIDAHAKLCVYCNRDPKAPVQRRQVDAAPPPPPPPAANSLSATVLPRIKVAEQKVGGKALMIGAAAMLLMASFAVGGLYYAMSKKAPSTPADERGPLVVDRDQPVTGVAMRPGAPVVTAVPGGPVTSAPAAPIGTPMAPSMQAGADATALPSDQYAVIAAQAQRVAQTPQTFQSADPTRVTTPPPGIDTPQSRPAAPVAPRPPRPAERPAESTAQQTGRYERPRPLSQPLPDFRDVGTSGTVRLNLTVGTSGRVEQIQIIESVPSITPKVIAAVQRWRFKPATRNGQPVSGEFPVDITFKESN